MSNMYAMTASTALESIQDQLDTFIFSMETGINTKEACQLIAPKIVELLPLLQSFEQNLSMRDGHAKTASSKIGTVARVFLRDLQHDGDAAESGKALREQIAQARRTFLSRDSMIRMSAV